MAEDAEKFVGHEGTFRGIPPIMDSLQARGISPEVVVEGLPYSVEQIRKDPGLRISWENFCRIMKNIGDAVANDEAVLEDIGREMVMSHSHRYAVVIGRLLFSSSEFFRWTSVTFTNELKAIRPHVVDLAENRILIEYEMREGYRMCREIFVILQGMYSLNQTELRVGRTKVHTEFTENGVRYDIRFKQAGGKLSWLRKSITWIWTARYAAETLREADEVISKRYADLLDETRARREAEEALVRVAEKEQERIRRDLHDRVGQELTGLSFLARRLVRKGRTPGANYGDELEAILQGIERAIGEVQYAIKGIQPVQATPDGLMDALDELVSKTMAHTGVNCAFECDGDIFLEDVGTASQLFYIAQEALNNACKYSEASDIRVQLGRRNGCIELAVRDNGIGLAESNGNGTGFGMNIMDHRARLIGGTLTVESLPEGGVAVFCRLPGQSERKAVYDNKTVASNRG